MYDKAERLRRVKLRVEELQDKKENLQIGILFSLCVMLSTFLIGIIGEIGGNGFYKATGFYGSMLMYENAGGLVLVGVISFFAAVAITVLYLRIKEQKKNIHISKKGN